jgi:hypothetical protein
MVIGYSLDTSALIDGIERFYPPRNFPPLWENIDKLIAEGRIRISEEAWREAVSADAALKDWCLEAGAGRELAVFETTPAMVRVVGEIGAAFPKWVQQGGKNGADPFVIAAAEVDSWIVISGETNGGPSRPKIPYVCGQRGVKHGRFVDLIRQEDWVLGV